MCFSANASFGAGIILAVISVASLKKVQYSTHIYFAAIPLIFCIQQITEGLLWLALTDPVYTSLEKVTTYSFLFFAQVIWPIWIPFAVLSLEKNSKYKTIQKILVGIGGLVSLYLAYCLTSFPIKAMITSSHILYLQDYPKTISNYGSFLYVLATIAPCFISRIKQMGLLGILILISYGITLFFYSDYTISVWCFFASIISIMIWYIMKNIE